MVNVRYRRDNLAFNEKMYFIFVLFININGYSDAGFDSLSTAVNSPFPDLIQMDLQVFRSNRPEQVKPFIEEVSGLISQTSSYQIWSNAVEKVTRDVILRNEKISRCVLNYRFQKSGLNVRIDSIEDLSGRKEEPSSLDFPTQIHLRRRKSAQSPVERYSLSPMSKLQEFPTGTPAFRSTGSKVGWSTLHQ